MMSKKILIIFWVAALAATFYSCRNAEGMAAGKTGEQIPILSWDEDNPGNFPAARYQEMREAGITHNFVRGIRSITELLTDLDAAQETGIKKFVWCPELVTDTEETVKRLMHHPALAGYHLSDEPHSSKFQELGALVRKIQAIDSTHACYINILSRDLPASMWGTGTYQEYVQAFIKEVPLPFLSFDQYPIRVNDNGIRWVSEYWHTTLEVFSDEAKKAGKPFWAFALTASHYAYPVPTLNDLRLQVYTNLAYGAQGIQYFNWMAVNTEFKSPPIEHDGSKTVVYDIVKEMNREIKHLSKVFLHASVVSVRHTGDVIPDNTQRLEKLPDAIKSFATEGEGAIVSVLEKGNDSFLVIVNRDINANLTVKIETAARVQRILKDGSATAAGSGMQTWEVTPGDVLIYSWK